MMTLQALSDRLKYILTADPELAERPFYVRIKRSSRTQEFVPIAWVSSSYTSTGGILMVEARAEEENIKIWDSVKGFK